MMPVVIFFAVHADAFLKYVSIVNPRNIPPDGENCPHSAPVTKTRIAWGE